jgi:hypothetical protein
LRVVNSFSARGGGGGGAAYWGYLGVWSRVCTARILHRTARALFHWQRFLIAVRLTSAHSKFIDQHRLYYHYIYEQRFGQWAFAANKLFFTALSADASEISLSHTPFARART